MRSSLLSTGWYCAVAIVARTAGWSTQGKATAATAGSVWLQPISAHGRASLAILDRHRAPTPLSGWNINSTHGEDRHGETYQRFSVLSIDIDIVIDEEEMQRTYTPSKDAQARLNQLVEHLHAVAGRLRIPSAILARYRISSEQTNPHPRGKRWATAAKHVDLSGVWKPIVTSDFNQDFNDYLVNCSLPFFHRKLLVNGIALQTEYIEQRREGQELEIVDKTPAGSWNRTLLTSGATVQVDKYEARNFSIKDPYGDFVQVEAWWEDMGFVHKSWLRGKPNSYGATIETSRYLEGDDTLVCESAFHPGQGAPASHRYAEIAFRFKRIS
mmetsp:Transcript_50265/g.76513  ORF Transcript_50265/g.76513 Transcript_50265/m.76513 type:complete len:327 (+) Transcript_50265:233-1213(+)